VSVDGLGLFGRLRRVRLGFGLPIRRKRGLVGLGFVSRLCLETKVSAGGGGYWFANNRLVLTC
jgi:hypothetical protein